MFSYKPVRLRILRGDGGSGRGGRGAWPDPRFHDEGVTWTQAIGRVELPLPPAEPVPIRHIYAALDGVPGHAAGEVIERLMTEGGMHPPGYYLAVNAWSRLFGSGRHLLALPAMLAGVLTLFGMRRLARELIPDVRVGDDAHGRAGEWAMLLMALSPWLVGYTVLARPYALALCLAVWSTVALLGMRSPGEEARGFGRRWPLAFVLLSLLGLYFVYHYAFLLLWQLGYLVLSALLGERERRRSRGLELVGIGAAIALGFAPWLPRLIEHLSVTRDAEAYFNGFPGLVEWPGLAWWLMLLFSFGESVYFFEAPLLQVAFLVLVTATLALLVTGRGGFEEGGSETSGSETGDAERRLSLRLLWISLPLLPAAILLADWLHDTRTLFVSKTSFVLFPFLVLGVVRAWLSLSSRRVAALGLCAWALLLAAAGAGGFYGLALRQTPVARVTAYLQQTDEPGHVVGLSSLYPGYAIPLLLSLRRAGVEQVSLAYAPWYALADFVEDASGDPTVKRLSLLNLDVSYSSVETWQPKLLRQVLATARRAGWDARLWAPADAAAAPGESAVGEGAPAAAKPRALRIVTPIQAKYFSG